jgi:hypothetical protein
MPSLRKLEARRNPYTSMTFYELINAYCVKCDLINETIYHFSYICDEKIEESSKSNMPLSRSKLVIVLVELDREFVRIKELEKRVAREQGKSVRSLERQLRRS